MKQTPILTSNNLFIQVFLQENDQQQQKIALKQKISWYKTYWIGSKLPQPAKLAAN